MFFKNLGRNIFLGIFFGSFLFSSLTFTLTPTLENNSYGFTKTLFQKRLKNNINFGSSAFAQTLNNNEESLDTSKEIFIQRDQFDEKKGDQFDEEEGNQFDEEELTFLSEKANEIIKKIRSLPTESFNLINREYNYLNYLEPEVQLPESFQNEYPQFCALLNDIQNYPPFKEEVQELKQIEKTTTNDTSGDHMAVYFAYSPELNHLLYYGKSTNAYYRMLAHFSYIGTHSHSNHGIHEVCTLCKKKNIDLKEIYQGKIFFRKIVKFKITNQNCTKDQFLSAKKRISQLEIHISRFLDQMQHKFFFSINVSSVEPFFNSSNKNIDFLFQEVFHQALVEKIDNLMGLPSIPPDIYKLSEFYQAKLKFNLEICIPIVNIKTGEYSSFIESFGERGIKQIREQITTYAVKKKMGIYRYATPDEIGEQKYMKQFDETFQNYLILPSQNPKFIYSGNFGVVGPANAKDEDMTGPRKYYGSKKDATRALYGREGTKKFYAILDFYQEMYEKCDCKRLWRNATFNEFQAQKAFSQYDTGQRPCLRIGFYSQKDKKKYIVGPNFPIEQYDKYDPRLKENLKLYISSREAARFTCRPLNKPVLLSLIKHFGTDKSFNSLTPKEKKQLYLSSFRTLKPEEMNCLDIQF